MVAAGLYTYALLRGLVVKTVRSLDTNAPTLEEMPPTIRGIANDDDDAVRRKLLSKHAPSPTLTGIARHEASEMGKPAGPAYQGTAENLPLTSEELEPDSAEVQEAVKALQTYRQPPGAAPEAPLRRPPRDRPRATRSLRRHPHHRR